MKTLLSLLLMSTFFAASAQVVVANLQAPIQHVDSNTNFSSRVEYHDNNADGTPSSIRTYVYDVNGNEVTYTNDSDADGVPHYIRTSTYDANGNKTSSSRDINADGDIDNINTFTYNSDGKLISDAYDSDADGNANSIYTFTYNSDGKRISESSDSNLDGNFNSIRTFTYGTNGKIITVSFDSNADGNANSIQTYNYDLAGNLISIYFDTNADSNPNEIWIYTYDAAGNETSEIHDNDGDGIPDNIFTYTYDENGNLISEAEDSDADGDSDYIETYVYNYNGHLISESYDTDVDGTPDEIILHSIEYFKSCAIISDRSNKMYKVNIPEDGEWVFSTCSDITNFDTKLYVGSTSCNQDLGENSDFCAGNKAELTVTFAATQDVYVILSSENIELGIFELKVEKVEPIDTVGTSLDNLNLQKYISVFPNPTNSTINIDIENHTNVEYQIYNLNGQLAQSGTLKKSTQIDLKGLNNGFYNISLNQKNTTYRSNFVVHK